MSIQQLHKIEIDNKLNIEIKKHILNIIVEMKNYIKR